MVRYDYINLNCIIINMKLSDSEKRDICKLIEQGQNIPEKYRFLLFDESKQIELKFN